MFSPPIIFYIHHRIAAHVNRTHLRSLDTKCITPALAARSNRPLQPPAPTSPHHDRSVLAAAAAIENGFESSIKNGFESFIENPEVKERKGRGGGPCI